MRANWTYAGAFVVQIDVNSNPTTGHLEGRIEHVASMRSARFAATEELIRFVCSTLAEEGHSRPAEDGTE
jgi:hypothetical protein